MAFLSEYREDRLKTVNVMFADYIAKNWYPNGRKGCWASIELDPTTKESKYMIDSTEELFEWFLNQKP